MFKMTPRRPVSKVLFVILLTGCTAGLRGEPESTIFTDSDEVATRDILRSAIKQELTSKKITAALEPSATPYSRNQVIFARLAELDRLYFVYELDLSRESRQTGLLEGLLAVGAGIGGTVSGTAAVSQAFSAASTVIAGANSAFEKEVLLERTIQSLTSQMRANRNNIKTDILIKMQENIAQYPLLAALSDLERYRQAGTLLGALLTIADKTTEDARVSEQRLQTRASQVKLDQINIVAKPVVVTKSTEERISAITSKIQNLSDEEAIRLVSTPPGRSANFDQFLEALSGGQPIDNGFVARSNLDAAVRTFGAGDDEALKAWETVLSIE